MTPKPLLYDLYCGAGGATKGYQRAGFRVIGIDMHEQSRYCGDGFIQMDALDFLRGYLRGEYETAAVFSASPPCQRYSVMTLASGTGDRHADLIGLTRQLLRATGKPYVIENVPGAPLNNPLMLCGTMFDETRVRRHRLFECSPPIWFPPALCNHDYGRIPRAGRGQSEHGYISIAGNFADVEAGRAAMGTPWMTRDEIAQAIPPAYCEYIGNQMRALL